MATPDAPAAAAIVSSRLSHSFVGGLMKSAVIEASKRLTADEFIDVEGDLARDLEMNVKQREAEESKLPPPAAKTAGTKKSKEKSKFCTIC